MTSIENNLKSNFVCSICRNKRKNISYVVEEKMYRTGDEFIYFKCNQCGCLQINEYPPNIEKFYDSSNYYSLQSKNKKRSIAEIRNWLKNQLFSYYLNNKNPLGFLLKKNYKDPYYWLPKNFLSFNSRILDIGCGNGGLLRQMAEGGFRNLYGIEPFLEKEIQHITENGTVVNIDKKQLSDINEKYDFIMLHHVFEHMPEPHKVIAKIRDIMNENAKILIRIPIVDSFLWREYKLDWFQIDAPRHFYLHSLKSIKYLLENHDLKINDLIYDGIWTTFYLSEKYKKGLSMLSEEYKCTKEDEKKYKKRMKELNKLSDSDQVCLLISKKNNEK